MALPKMGGYPVFSGGPVHDTTPKDLRYSNVCGYSAMTDAMQMSSFGPPYGIPIDGKEFDELTRKLAQQPGVTNPAALAAHIERKKGLMK